MLSEETDSNADRYRESDRSSNLSDVKADIRAGSSVSNAESVTALDSEGEGSTRGVNALALAGPVPNPMVSGFRYSADYTEPSFPPKSNVSVFVNHFSCKSLMARYAYRLMAFKYFPTRFHVYSYSLFFPFYVLFRPKIDFFAYLRANNR